jgi:hypothetical protein
MRRAVGRTPPAAASGPGAPLMPLINASFGDLAGRPDVARRRDRLVAVCVVHASCWVDWYWRSKQ